jgi:hypothetical protein
MRQRVALPCQVRRWQVRWPIATLPQEFMSAMPESGQTRTDANDPQGDIRVGVTMKSPRQEARGLHSPDVTPVSTARRQIYS